MDKNILEKVIKRELERRKILRVLKTEAVPVYKWDGSIFVITPTKGILLNKKI